MRNVGRLLALGLAAALGTVALCGAPALADSSTSAQILDGERGVNYYRAQVGSAPVTEDAELSAYAQERADDALTQHLLTHDASFWQYRLDGRGFAELLGTRISPDALAGAWSDSNSHYPLMISDQYTRAGIGYAVDAQGGYSYAVMVLSTAAVSQDPPEAPSGVEAAIRGNQITAVWNDSAASGSASLHDYIAYLYSGGEQVQVQLADASSREVRFDNLERGKRYLVRVGARSTSGVLSDLSAPSNEVLLPSLAPSSPRALGTFQSGAGLGVYWNAPASDNGEPVRRYEVAVYRNAQLILSASTTNTAYALANPEVGSYRFEVAAINAVGTSSAAISTEAKVLADPPVSSEVKHQPVAQPAVAEAKVNEHAVAEVIPPAPPAAETPISAAGGQPTTSAAKEVVPAKSQQTSPARVAKPAASSASRGRVSLRWSASSRGASAIDRYEIKVGGLGKIRLLSTGGKVRSLALKFPPKKSLTLSIRAHSTSGWGAYSASVRVRTRA